MKKMISVILVVLLCFSLTVPVFAADYKDTVKHANREAIDVIDTLGIIEGYPDSYFGPEDMLTRAQMTTMLARAVLPSHIGSYREASFDDVPYTHWAYDYITTAYTYGLVNGYGDNKFGPDDLVTYPQLAAMLLNVLGYNALNFSWPNGIIEYAYRLGMFDNIKAYYYDEVCTRAGAAQMIYNTLTMTSVVKIGSIYYSNDSTLLKMMGFEEVEPTEVNGDYMRTFLKDKKYYVTNTVVSSIYDGVMEDWDRVIISNKTYKIDWSKTLLYVNEELVSSNYTYLVPGDRVTVVMGDDGTIYSVSFLDIQTFAPGEELPPEVAYAIARDKNYNPYTSTISYINPTKYYISNTYVFDYIVESYTVHGVHYLILANDQYYWYDKFDQVEADQWIIIYFDYFGEISGFQTFKEDKEIVEKILKGEE